MAYPATRTTPRARARRRTGTARRCRPRVELLEPRRLLSVFTVTTVQDSGAGSLRSAMLQANASPGLDTIAFEIGTGPQTIIPTTLLPTLTGPTILDGTTQPGFTTTPLIELSGSNRSGPALQLLGGDSIVRGLIVNAFDHNAIELLSPRNVVEGCWIGLDRTGTEAASNQFFGVYVSAADNRIGGTTSAQGNVISGNYLGGIHLRTSAAIGNVIQGNRIGTDASGMLSVRNVGGFNTGAIKIEDAPGNQIGGHAPGAGNLISGNGSWAVEITGTGAIGNTIAGNVIGLDLTGRAALRNGGGVRIDRAGQNTVGGSVSGARNVISASGNGVYITGAQAVSNLVRGNLIGLDVTGTTADADDQPGNGNELGNAYGVYILDAPGNQLVQNVISGNTAYAVGIFGAGASGNVLQGNFVGTDLTGTQAIRGSHGLAIQAPETLIGGTAPGAGNVISGHVGSGVWIYGANATGNRLQGNLIGVAADGTTPLGNSEFGVYLQEAADSVIGGLVSEAANVISANGAAGIALAGNAARGSRVQGNWIGTDRSGVAELGNGAAGIVLVSGATDNLIGGTEAGAGNVIVDNHGAGVQLSAPSPNNTVQGNWIGVDRAGSVPHGNAGHGIEIATSGTLAGGTSSQAGNVVAYNGGHGIWVSQGTRNTLVGNTLYANVGLGIDLYPFLGVTANDPGDGDTGANLLQNYPELSQVVPQSRGVRISGQLQSTPDTDFQLDFYASPGADDTGFGEGARYLGRAAVRTDAAGAAAFDVVVSGVVPRGAVVTATATDPDGNTSEFSRAAGTSWKSDLERFLEPRRPFAGPSDTHQPGTTEAVAADTAELRDLEYLAQHVPLSDLAALGHVDTPLLILYSRFLQGIATPLAEQTLHGTPYAAVHSTDGTRPHVQAFVANVPVARSLLEALGMVITSVRDSDAWKIVAGFLPIATIGDVARLDMLNGLQASERGTTDAQGAVASQAEAVSLAAQLQRVLITVDGNEGSLGGRIDIGVISDSISQVGGGVAASQASGDLPPGNRVRVLDDGGASDTDEGRAMAELVYDMGPAFDILFHSRNDSPSDMAEALEDLRRAGADIITEDISWFSEPVFQDGVVADTIQAIYRDHGTLIFGSAGNRNNESYVGTWLDDDGDDLHEFAGGDETLNVQLADQEQLSVYLHWNEPWGHSGVDIDLELYDATLTTKLADSNQDNNPLFNLFEWTGLPLESLTFTNTSGATQNYHLALRFDDGDSPAGISLYMFAPKASDDFSETYVQNNPGITGNHTAPNMFAIAAVPYWNTSVAESFSSHGPNEIHFSTNGNRLNEPEIRQKPDFAAIDNVDNTFFGRDSDGNGLLNFSGTSAASPNAAAIAGLVIDAADRMLSYNELTTIFRKTATGPTLGAWDSTFGEGVLNALGAGLMARGMRPTEVYLELNPFGDLTTSEHALDADFDTDRFVFASDVTGDVTIQVSEDMATLDPGLIVWNVEHRELDHIDYNSGPDGDDALLVERFTSGTLAQLEVFTEATIGGAGANAGYTLAIHAPDPFVLPIELDENGDGTASDVILAGDADYFEFQSPAFAGRRVTLTVTPVAQLDTVVSLYDADGELLERIQSAGAGGVETLVFEAVQSDQTYYVRVGAAEYASSGRFDVTIDCETAAPGELTDADGFVYFHHDGQSRDGQTFSQWEGDAHIDQRLDTDSFYLCVDQSGPITLEAWRESGDVQPHLEVYDAGTGEPLPAQARDLWFNFESLSVELAAQRRYIVAVSDRRRDGSGDVSLYVTGPAAQEILEIGIDVDGQGTRSNVELGIREDMDFFHFRAPADSDESVTITVAPGIGLDAAAVLFDSQGEELGKAYLHGLHEAETITVDQVVPGADYYLTVLSRDYASHGHYDVTVDFGVVRGTIGGTKYRDANENGQRDAGEAGLGGWVLYVDQDQDGAFDLGGHVEPDEFDPGDVLGQASPAVTLRAVGAGVTTGDVSARVSGLASSGFEVFASDWQADPLWSAGQAEMHGELLVPVAAVRLDFIADDADDVGQLEAYDAHGNRIGRIAVQPGAGQWQAMTIAFPDARIASFRAFAVGGAGRLDRLVFGAESAEPFDVTDLGGHYELRGLALADHDVREVLRAGWTQTAPAAGGRTVALTLEAPIARDVDFGNFAPPQLTGTVWHDVDGDQVRQAAEAALTGRIIYLDENHNSRYDADEESTLTDADGHYVFAGLPAGAYAMGQALPLGTGQSLPSAPGIYAVQLDEGQLITGLDFGTYFGSTVVGRVYQDLDRDGQRDAEDQGLDGRTVYIDLRGDGLTADDPAAVTALGGSYVIEPVPPGTWPVKVVAETGWSVTGPAAGQHLLTILSDSRHFDIDFGVAEQLDYGDAPAPYPTRLVVDGARHRFDPQLRLGHLWDAEVDGWPAAQADGDDHDQQDDEDGVTFLTPLIPGQEVQVRVVSSAPAILDAWVDFHRDGDWTDAGERVLAGQALVAGPQVLAFTLPDFAAPGTTYTRFRLTSTGAASATGAADDGEVEDYRVNIDNLWDLPLVVPPVDDYGPLNPAGDRDLMFTFSTPSDRATWRFSTKAGGPAVFTATGDASSGLHPLLALYNGLGDLVAVGGGAASPSSPSELTYVLTPGADEVYTLLVQDRELNTSGNIHVHIDTPTVALVEPLVLDTAGRGARDGVLITHTLPPLADVDYFALAAVGDGSPDPSQRRMAVKVTPHAAYQLEYQLFDGAGLPIGDRVMSSGDGQPAEHVYLPLPGGPTSYVAVFARRFEDHPAGGAYTLEVELDTYDFGDAPVSYATQLADQGARHRIVPGMYLGAAVDDEWDGQPTPGADGDDAASGDDEDGVVLTESLSPGHPAEIQVRAAAAGRLDAWIDWDRDGAWSDPGERVFLDEPLAAGDNLLTLRVPVGAQTGETFARFRFSSRGGLAPTGPADDGEVEDYAVTVEASGSIRGTLWHDLNTDGRRDGGEPGLAGWTVFLDEDRDQQLDEEEAAVVTDQYGHYAFADVAPGTYEVAQIRPVGWHPQYPAVTPNWLYVTMYRRELVDPLGYWSSWQEIQIFDFETADGLIERIDSIAPPEFAEGYIHDLEIGPGGDLYVGRDRGEEGDILQFTYDGILLRTIPLPPDPVDPESGHVYRYPLGFDVLPDGRLLVAQPNSHQIVLLDPNGVLLETFALPLFTPFDAGMLSDGFLVWSDGATNAEMLLNVRFDDRYWIGTFLALRDVAGNELDVGLQALAFEAIEIANARSQSATPGFYFHPGTVWGVFNDLWVARPFAEGGGYHMQVFNDLAGVGLALAMAHNEVPFGEPIRDFLDGGEGGGEPTGPSAAALVGTGYGSWQVRVDAGASVTGADFGRVRYGQVTGEKFFDIDGDGVRASLEPAVAGARMWVDVDGDGVRDGREPTAVTDADGRYVIDNVLPGTFVVREEPHQRWTPTYPAAGGYEIAVVPGSLATTVDFGGAAATWQNPVWTLDANADQHVSPADALVIINRLNAGLAGPLAPPSLPHATPPRFVDTSGDAYLSPRDALLVINHINRDDAGGAGEDAEAKADRAEPARWDEPTVMTTSVPFGVDKDGTPSRGTPRAAARVGATAQPREPVAGFAHFEAGWYADRTAHDARGQAAVPHLKRAAGRVPQWWETSLDEEWEPLLELLASDATRGGKASAAIPAR